MIAGLIAGVVSVASLAGAQDTTGSLHGRILSAADRAPIEGATVRIRHGGSYRLVVSGAGGRYRAAGIAAGEARVVAYAIDHAPLEAGVRIPTGGTVELDMELEIRPIRMPTLFAFRVVAGNRLPPPGLTRGGFRGEGETELRALESSPGVAELGLAGNGSVPPDPTDPTSTLYVRGAFADLKLVLLDGAPVYAPFHLGGLMDAFPDGVLEEATIYAGGTPAKYGGGLSYVLDLELREGGREAIRGAGSADFLGATARFEGPIGPDAGFLVNGRALHGAGYRFVSGQDDLPYRYGDALGRLDIEAGPGRLSATGFWNRESVNLDLGKLEETGAPESAYWGNTSGSVRYRTPLGGGVLDLVGAYGRFTTRIPIFDEGADGPVDFSTARGENSRSRTRASYSFPAGGVEWSVGAGYDTHENVLDERAVFGDTTASSIVRAHVAAAWGEAIWEVAPAVELRAGLRAEHFRPSGGVKLAPRLSALWDVGERAELRLAIGRFNQVVRGPETILSSDLTGPTTGLDRPGLDDPGVPPAGGLFRVAGATHLVVGMENRLEHGIDIGLEGHFKTFDGLPEVENLYSSGADLWLEATEGPVRGWVGYSLAWVWSTERAQDTRFVGRQLLSGGLTTSFSGVELGVRLAYGAGLPFADVSTGAIANQADGGGGVEGFEEEEEEPAPALAGAPDDSYLRIDAEISRRWVATVGDSDFEIAPYLRLLNALDRRDALFYRADEEGPTRPAPLASVPLIAVFGVAWTF